ncbi:MAG TPA: hypothetical protein VND88_10745 [Candidatus Acidoferrales bacterium]|nr:hypothetical protein [Candidatus Acidoferrales bacterium]
MGVKTRAWLIPASSEQSRGNRVPPQLLDAWTAIVGEWDWLSPAIRERNVGLIQRHYHDDRDVAAWLPSGLVRDWSRDGSPEPSTWIEAKLESILSDEGHRSVA